MPTQVCAWPPHFADRLGVEYGRCVFLVEALSDPLRQGGIMVVDKIFQRQDACASRPGQAGLDLLVAHWCGRPKEVDVRRADTPVHQYLKFRLGHLGLFRPRRRNRRRRERKIRPPSGIVC